MVGDLLTIVCAVVAVGVFKTTEAAGTSRLALMLGLATGATALLALPLSRAWDPRVLGQGPEEFRRVGRAALTGMVALALVALATDIQGLRGWVFAALPAFAGIAIPVRYLLRRVLHRRRRLGSCLLPVLAAGSPEAVRDLIERTRKDSHLGWRVEAVCTPHGAGYGRRVPGEIAGVPVVGDLDDLVDRVRLGGYRMVAVAGSTDWTPARLQRLAWELEGSTAELVVAPSLVEIAGPRLHVAPVFGLTMLWVSAPTFSGAGWLVKAVVDRLSALLLAVLLSPAFLVIALAIKTTSRGPVLYRQSRVGRDGRMFTMLKFRSMVPDAHHRKAELAGANQAAGPLFKMRSDPRVTRVGAVLRRYSMDELPQIFNVLAGSMSLVGPRPPLPEEVARYGPDARRRLLVKPGLTGLWQVSGRSDLSWEESVRLDLRYVESWSLFMDLVILWKTASAVVGGRGAY
ncbi:sugar transferase [Crossiella cryophila]|uniref:sugar transferase n=1 Tax=Crossiella cryophila TaxID=43355 RepID=UPI0028A68A8F|nr:sugar transferase [Crossiella cryophila]